MVLCSLGCLSSVEVGADVPVAAGRTRVGGVVGVVSTPDFAGHDERVTLRELLLPCRCAHTQCSGCVRCTGVTGLGSVSARHLFLLPRL